VIIRTLQLMLYGKIIAAYSEIHKHHKHTSEDGMQNYCILRPHELLETSGLERVK
jgi:hypothetical protein